jgi:hypothetical protein
MSVLGTLNKYEIHFYEAKYNFNLNKQNMLLRTASNDEFAFVFWINDSFPLFSNHKILRFFNICNGNIGCPLCYTIAGSVHI